MKHNPSHSQNSPAIEALVQDRQKGWHGFTRATVIASVATAAVLVMLWLVFIVILKA